MTKIETIISRIRYDMDKLELLINNGFDPLTPLATPEEVKNSGRGICHETAIYMADLFNNKKIKHFTFIFTTKHSKSGAILHHSGTVWCKYKKLWIIDSVGKTIGFKSENELRKFLNEKFTEIESPIVKWKNLGQLQKFNWTYGEWVSQL